MCINDIRRCTVIWNPWSEYAKEIPDFGDDEFPNMVCVEAGRVAAPIVLLPGTAFEASQILQVWDQAEQIDKYQNNNTNKRPSFHFCVLKILPTYHDKNNKIKSMFIRFHVLIYKYLYFNIR